MLFCCHCFAGYPQTQQWSGTQPSYPAMFSGLYPVIFVVVHNKQVNMSTDFQRQHWRYHQRFTENPAILLRM